MKIKNFFNALIMAFLTISLFVSCEPTNENGNGNENEPSITLNKDGIYLLGNCTDPINSREDGRFGMPSDYTVAVFTMLTGEKLLAHGDAIVGVRALVDGEVSDAEVIVANKLDLDNGIVARKSFSYVEGGWQYVLLDKPIKITGDTLYVGYKITSAGFVIGFEPTSKMTSTEYMLSLIHI